MPQHWGPPLVDVPCARQDSPEGLLFGLFVTLVVQPGAVFLHVNTDFTLPGCYPLDNQPPLVDQLFLSMIVRIDLHTCTLHMLDQDYGLSLIGFISSRVHKYI